jgi:O-antigen ligase
MQTLLARGNLAALQTQADPSVQVRAGGASQALPGLAAHPLLGNGAGSFGMAHQDDQGAPGWLSNLELHLWYDSGLLGLGAVALGLGALGRAGWRGALHTPAVPPDLRAAMLGLIGAGVALLVAYQATEGSWMAFSWVYVGLLARAGRVTTAYTQGLSIHEPSDADEPCATGPSNR